MGEPEKQAKRGTGDAEPEAGRAFAATELGVGAAATPSPSAATRGGAATPAAQSIPPDEEGPDLLIGRVLGGHYKVEARIGEGGMGTVYRALHIHLDKHFAVKVLSRKIAENKSAVERLKQEAQAASRIDHDNIVDVVHFDATDEGDVYIVMELLRGAPLADILERGRLDLPRAVHIAAQICRALHAAHEHGIIHRDLKPENVFIVRKHDEDFVKVLDFGISKIKSADAEQVRMTKTGQLVGTPLYMSPEQAKGESDVDRRVDVYALGVILYEMLTGTPPFQGDNYFQLLWKHGNDLPDPPSLRCPEADIPAGVEAVILEALAKEPGDRFDDMQALEEALMAAASVGPAPRHLVSMPSLPSSVPTPDALARPARRSTSLVAGLGVAALALVGLGAWALSGGGVEGGDTRTDERAPGAAGPGGGPSIDTAPRGTDPRGPDPRGPAPGDPGRPSLPEGVDPPPAPALVSVQFDSTPEGATVTAGGAVLGVTPLVRPIPASDLPVEVRFSREGYRDHVLSVVPVEGARVRGALRPERRNGAGNGAGGGAPIKGFND